MCPSQKISVTGTAKEIKLNVSKGTVCVQVKPNFWQILNLVTSENKIFPI